MQNSTIVCALTFECDVTGTGWLRKGSWSVVIRAAPVGLSGAAGRSALSFRVRPSLADLTFASAEVATPESVNRCPTAGRGPAIASGNGPVHPQR